MKKIIHITMNYKNYNKPMKSKLIYKSLILLLLLFNYII